MAKSSFDLNAFDATLAELGIDISVPLDSVADGSQNDTSQILEVVQPAIDTELAETLNSSMKSKIMGIALGARTNASLMHLRERNFITPEREARASKKLELAHSVLDSFGLFQPLEPERPIPFPTIDDDGEEIKIDTTFQALGVGRVLTRKLVVLLKDVIVHSGNEEVQKAREIQILAANAKIGIKRFRNDGVPVKTIEMIHKYGKTQ